ncbi:MAG: restriction endonuclease subunit S, partial [Clostridiales bacterium]|nr:restriction endonuclease subunit S [Clostridiales bacterium]
WEQRKFGDIAQRQSESMISDNENPCIEYEDIITESGLLNKDVYSKSARKNGIRFTPSDVLYGKLRPYLHNWYNPDFAGVAVGDWWVLRPVDSDKHFLYRLIQTAQYDDAANQSSGTKMPRADWKIVSNTVFSIPTSRNEQSKIATLFNILDSTITLHQCKYYCLGTGDLNNKSDPFSPHNTVTWEQRKLNEYLEVSKAKNKDEVYGKEDVLSVSGDYGIVNQIEFQGRSFAGVSVAPYGVVETGDVVYTKSPLKSNPYGIIKANKGKPGIVSTLYAVYKPLDNVSSEFVQIYFEQDSRMNNYMHPLVNKGAKNDMKVSDENALKGEVCFPSRDEQIKISEYFAKLDNLITLHQRRSFYAFIIIMVH